MAKTAKLCTPEEAADMEQRQRGEGRQPGHAFKPGNTLGGRKKGARNRLGAQFLMDVEQDWEAHGAAVIAAAREKDPAAYMKVIASILPRTLNINADVQHEHRIVPETTQRIFDEITGRAEDAGNEISGADRPVLPAPVCAPSKRH